MTSTRAGLLGRRAGLGVRLLAAQLLVILAGSITLAVVAVLVAPGTFTRHLDRAGETDPMVRGHAQDAFESAFGLALGVATLVAVVTATVVSTIVVRRLTAPVSELARAADALAAGDYGAPVPDARLGPEFDRLTSAFTGMAARLARTELTRRRLMADLAHEMRTPVNTLAAHVDGLEDGVVPTGPATWEVLRHQLDRLTRLSADLAQLSAAEEHVPSVERRVVDLVAVARSAVDAAEPAYRAKGVRLVVASTAPTVGSAVGSSVEARAGSVEARVDEVRLQQVLANLLENALRHTPAGGCVTVATGRDRQHAVVAVTDTGSGIPTDELESVFERFHRVDSARARTADGAGSGLGLTIARAIVTDHGGTLTASSPGPGAGATFTIRLPAA